MTLDSIGTTTATTATAAAGSANTGCGRAAQDFAALTQAFQQGDMSAAQQAFVTLQQDVPWLGRAATAQPGTTAASGPVTSALQVLGSALRSGDLAGARQAFANLQQAHGGHHGHHHRVDSQAQPQPGTTSTATTGGAAVDTHA